MTNNNNNGEASQNGTPENSAKRLLKVGITHGDVNGIGYELILKTFSENAMFDICIPVVYGSVKAGTYHRKVLGTELNYHIVNTAAEAEPNRLNLINCFDEEINIEMGRINAEAGHAAFLALEQATEDLKNGSIDVLVTAPICKSAIQNADFRFSGHTEYLSNRLVGDKAEPLMILANNLMRVALVTTHLPVKEVAAAITGELVEQKVKQLYHSLQHDFLISAPRIAVLGLNPHNGDNGTLGSEEQEIIAPAIKASVENGIQCFGPYPADGFFGSGMYAHFDGILAMYHDQALAPFKALSMDDGVNFTAELPYVRTSPDHGTAFDIAGKNMASCASFRQAIYTAIDIYRNRQADNKAHRNPLPKLYHEHREDGDRQRHMKPAGMPKAEAKEIKEEQ